MTENDFRETLIYNEPDFEYKGKEYSICSPDGKFYVLAEDAPTDRTLEFVDADDLLNRWIIQGKPLREILPYINMD